MFRTILVLCLLAAVAAFSPYSTRARATTALQMKNEVQKVVGAGLVGASLFLGGVARADIDYDGIKYLGGGEKVCRCHSTCSVSCGNRVEIASS